MSDDELKDALIYMAKVPTNDTCYFDFNFDPYEWKNKYIELITEALNRNVKG